MMAFYKAGVGLWVALLLAACTGAEETLPPRTSNTPVNTVASGSQPSSPATTTDNSTTSGNGGVVPTAPTVESGPGTSEPANPFAGETPEMQEVAFAPIEEPAECTGLLGEFLEPIACQSQLEPMTRESLKSFLCSLEPIASSFPAQGEPIVSGANTVTRLVAETLFGPCDPNIIQGPKNLTVYVRIPPRIAPTRFAEVTETSVAVARHRQLVTDVTLEGGVGSAGENLVFEIVVEGAHANPIEIRYTTGLTSYPKIDEIYSGEATAGFDYVPVAGSLTAPPVAANQPPQVFRVSVTPIGDAICEDDELFGFRITHVVHSEVEDPGLPNKGAPQLIQKAALGEILSDDNCSTPVQSARCGNSSTGKKLVLSARTFAIQGTGMLAGMIPQALRDQGTNERRYSLVIDGDGKNESSATPPLSEREGAILDLSDAGDGSRTLYNLAQGVADLQPRVLALAAVENLQVVGLVNINAAVAAAQLSASYVLAGPSHPPLTDPAQATIAFNAAGSGAVASFGNLSLLDEPIILDSDSELLVPPNTLVNPPPSPAFPLSNARLILNEQLAEQNTPETITAQTTSAKRSVNLLHLTSDQGELIIGHSEVSLQCVAK